VGILDADKTGFLRSATALTQTIGRAARNVDGYVILYADVKTEAIKFAMSETERRRKIQLAYNKKHNITPQTIKKAISQAIQDEKRVHKDIEDAKTKAIPLEDLRKQMLKAASNLEFEEAARLRDIITERQKKELFA
jgi:excinuclease ABC subunit B